MYYNDQTLVYLDGKIIKATEARIDLYSQSLHYGYSVFEGIRSYKTVKGETKIFKASEHFKRLINSAEALNIPFPYEVEDLIAITYDLLSKNNLQDAYIRPLLFAPANMSFSKNKESHFMIAVWEMKPFFGNKHLRVMTSSFQRPNPKGFRMDVKAAGHYVNSIMASHEAKEKGFDEALLTDINGYAAEGTGANVFFEKDGKIFTPPQGNILAGITRATVIEICNEAEIPFEEKLFTVDELKEADTVFFCGTAAEIIGWESLDDIKFKKHWDESLGKFIQDTYKTRVTEGDQQKAKSKVEKVQQETTPALQES